MSENLLNTKSGIIGLIFGALLGSMVTLAFLISMKFIGVDYSVAQAHIKTVTVIDRNCNDCHLGASFVNLFNHPAVKNDNNVVNKMMDNAKIKRW